MRTITRVPLSAVALFALALLPQAVSAGTVQVSVLDNSYSPQNVNINPGDTVVWTNYGSLAHTVMADSGMFTSSTMNPGVNFAYTFNTPGTYTYHDQSYGGVGMTGAINVAGQTVVTGGSGSSGSVASLQAEAQSLLAEIAQLQAQLGAGGSSGAVATTYACPSFGERALSLGSSGSDVLQLQQYLASNPNIYPGGQVTGYFGVLTQAAVQRWQATYGVVSSGSPSTTGWGVVGPRTAAAISQQCASGSTNISGSIPASALSAPSAAGVIQVTPTSGSAPLAVSVVTTVNAMGSCSGTTYVLNFGDGTQSTAIPTQQGVCAPVQQTYTHTYTYGGTYTIVLAGGTHQTTALVTVAGNPSPSAAAASGIPSDSLTASITSGPAPLVVVFTGTVSSLSSYGCTGSCSDTINFGDGAVGLVQIPTTSGSWQSYVINHTYSAVGSYTAQLSSASGAAEGSPITITVATPANQVGGSYNLATISAVTQPYSVSASISLPACGAYEVSWGDGSSPTTRTGTCTAGGTTILVPHTFPTQATGAKNTYTITLMNGSGAVQGSSSSYTIQT